MPAEDTPDRSSRERLHSATAKGADDSGARRRSDGARGRNAPWLVAIVIAGVSLIGVTWLFVLR